MEEQREKVWVSYEFSLWSSATTCQAAKKARERARVAHARLVVGSGVGIGLARRSLVVIVVAAAAAAAAAAVAEAIAAVALAVVAQKVLHDLGFVAAAEERVKRGGGVTVVLGILPATAGVVVVVGVAHGTGGGARGPHHLRRGGWLMMRGRVDRRVHHAVSLFCSAISKGSVVGCVEVLRRCGEGTTNAGGDEERAKREGGCRSFKVFACSYIKELLRVLDPSRKW